MIELLVISNKACEVMYRVSSIDYGLPLFERNEYDLPDSRENIMNSVAMIYVFRVIGDMGLHIFSESVGKFASYNSSVNNWLSYS